MSKTLTSASRSLKGSVLTLLASVVALVFAPTMASAASLGESASASVDATRTGTIVITKLDADEQTGTPGTGVQIDTTGMTPLSGATFEAKRVPDVDLATNEGWQEAQSLSVDAAAASVAGIAASASGVTGSNGVVELSDLPVGLYYVEEVSAPAGYLKASPFLVTVPMTNPDGNGWMYTVYAYPKNTMVDIELSVIDQDAVKIGDTVSWEGSAAIPMGTLDQYLLTNKLHSGLSLNGGADGVEVGLSCPRAGIQGKGSAPSFPCPQLERDKDYVVRKTSDGFEIEFTTDGLRKLEAARTADPNARVTVAYSTTVLTEGELTSTLSLDTRLRERGPC